MKWFFIPVLLLLASCGPENTPPPPSLAARGYRASDFCGAAAFREVDAFLKVGSGVSGSPACSNGANYISERLRALGLSVSVDAFEAATPGGVKTFRNIVGVIPGNPERIVILGAHYDLKAGIDSFVGANDSGSGVGLLLAMVPVLKAGSPGGAEVWLVFLDGEECLVNYGANDGLHGSRHLAGQLVEQGRAAKVQAFILADMIGDKDLNVTIPQNSTPALISLVFKAATAGGTRASFSMYPYSVLDDHQPFLEKGIPAIDLIDFQYGSAPRLNDYWHTPNDTLDKLSGASLEVVGQVILRVLNELQVGAQHSPPVSGRSHGRASDRDL